MSILRREPLGSKESISLIWGVAAYRWSCKCLESAKVTEFELSDGMVMYRCGPFVKYLKVKTFIKLNLNSTRLKMSDLFIRIIFFVGLISWDYPLNFRKRYTVFTNVLRYLRRKGNSTSVLCKRLAGSVVNTRSGAAGFPGPGRRDGGEPGGRGRWGRRWPAPGRRAPGAAAVPSGLGTAQLARLPGHSPLLK